MNNLVIHRSRLFCFAFALSFFVAACAAGQSHQNFKNWMQSEIGRKIEDPYAYRNQYSQWKVSTKVLANGNLEEEYKTGRYQKCRVFFEIDKKVGMIINWRYEGNEEYCAVRL